MKISELLERLYTLNRSLIRRCATEQGLLPVHVEILLYLSRINNYSNTALALTEYLGITKGSLSQSISHLERLHLIRRERDLADGRLVHMKLTPEGRKVIDGLDLFSEFDSKSQTLGPEDLREILRSIQTGYGMRSFGICETCRFHEKINSSAFVCGLTKEKLSTQQAKKMCREHTDDEK